MAKDEENNANLPVSMNDHSNHPPLAPSEIVAPLNKEKPTAKGSDALTKTIADNDALDDYTSDVTSMQRRPERNRKAPAYLNDYEL